MNKLMLASLTMLLAGATAVPAVADDGKRSAGGEQSWQGGNAPGDVGGDARQGDKGRYREEGRSERSEGRGGQPEYRQADRGGQPESRQEHRGGRTGDRQDWQADRGDQRYEQRPEQRHDSRQAQAYARHDARPQRYDSRYDNRYDGRYDNRHDNRYDRRDYRQDYRGHGGHNRYVRHDDRRWNGYHWYPQYRYRAPTRYMYPAGYRPYQWRVGHRLPPGYYGRNYYVDYNYYRLPPPPYGYGWVRVDRDVVLVALATGVILDALYGLYY